ncbi:MAG: PKD domain-containing protein, partial [Bacteroidia bacterium]
GQGAQGTNDPIWQVSDWFYTLPQSPLTLNYVPAYISNNCAPGAWVDPASLPPPVNNGNWISGSDMVCTGVAGYRYFRLTLNLPPDCGNFSVTTPGSYTLYMDGYVDNVLIDVMINGVSENLANLPGGNFMAGGQVSLIIDGPWVPGINYVDFLVYNAGGPYGLLMVANTTNSSNSDMDADGVADINDLCPCDFGTNPVGCVDPPNYNNCNITQIRAAFSAAGCIELPQCMSSCSMYFLNPQSMTGSQAQAFAQTLGANLISIQSLAENQCIMSELNRLNQTGVIWIGFNDENVEGTFEWYDQSPVTFTNWAPGEPNNSGGNEDCVQIYPNGFWNDLPCNVGNSKSIIEVNLCPIVEAGLDQAGCNGTTFNLNASNTLFGSAPYNYQWSNGANTQNTTVTPTSTTTYGVISIDRYGCIAADSLTITVYDNPVSQFTFNNVCFSESAQFTDNSVANSAGGIISWQWDFGDGNNSTQQNASNNYISDGTYNVTLTVTNANNCTNSSTQTITIYPKPDANFTFINQCDGNAVPFNSTSTINAPDNITNYFWDFGDNTNGSGTSINHLYSSTGLYNVTLIVTSNNSCSDTILQQVTVFNNPIANFTFTDVCLGYDVNFNNTSSVNNPDVINSYQWVFGDGSPIETIQNPNHTYTTPGAYNVTLIVGTSNGCSDAQTQTVNIYDP